MMKRSFISCYKMMLCAAILAMSTFMVSCVDNDDNVTPTPPSDEYVLDVEEGMTLPVNAFLKVPAIDGDPKIIAALKAIDKVTDVMAFAKVVGYDYWKDKVITKTDMCCTCHEISEFDGHEYTYNCSVYPSDLDAVFITEIHDF